MINLLQYISILMELVIAVLGILIAVRKHKMYGWGFALTFFIYVFYDLSKLVPLQISASVLYPLFFIATASALFAVLGIYMKK
ncbi:MAG: hypothetical protein V1886_01305 [archaeon]